MKKAVLYLRISQYDDDSTAIVRQREELEAWALREGWVVVDTLIDEGISGRKDRANSELALEMLRSGEVDVLSVWKFDRWSRQGLRAVVDLIDALEANPGAMFRSKEDGLDSTSAVWGLLASVLAFIAKIEADNTALRVRNTVDYLRRNGRHIGRIPYGYQSQKKGDGGGTVLAVAPEEAAVVRECYRRLIDRSEPLYAIVRDLQQRGIRPRSAEHFSRGTLQTVLTGRAILGQVVHHGEPIRGEDGMPLQVWEPVVPLDQWQTVQDILSPKPRSQMRRRMASLGSGLVHCGHCRGGMYVGGNGRKGSQARSYRCQWNQRGVDCPGCTVNQYALDEYLEERFLDRHGLDRLLAEQPSQEREERARLAAINAELEKVGAAIAHADDDELDELLGRRKLLRASMKDATLAVEKPRRLVRLGEMVTDAWEDASLERKQEILRMFIGRIDVTPTGGKKVPVEDRLSIGWIDPEPMVL